MQRNVEPMRKQVEGWQRSELTLPVRLPIQVVRQSPYKFGMLWKLRNLLFTLSHAAPVFSAISSSPLNRQ